MIDLINMNDNNYKAIYETREDIMEMIKAELDVIPLLSERYENALNEYSILRTEVDKVKSKEIFQLFLIDSIRLIEKNIYNADYYAEYCANNGCWELLHPMKYLKDKVITLDNEYDRFFSMIRNNNNFALTRSGDGEHALAIGKKVKAQENWESPNYVSKLGEAIIDSFKINEDNFYYAISCPCCDPGGYYWFLQQITNTKNVTIANIWGNINYRRFITDFESLDREAIVIANYRAKGKRIGNLKLIKYYSVTDDCVDFWENGAEELMKELAEDNKKRNGILYVVSAGPLSNPIIAALYRNNPNNCYVDFGSAIDRYIHEKETRPYNNPNSYYANKLCWIPRPDTIKKPSITAVMTLYKRPDVLLKQLEALENQTIKPDEIILFQDAIENCVYKIDLMEEIKKRFNHVSIQDKNVGVWGRFEFAQRTAKSDYVCIFDDDTIPGKKWFENCYMHMQQHEGIYVCIGIGLHDKADYPFGGYYRVGWAAPAQENIEVDFGGHSWFVKKEYLDVMFAGNSEFKKKYKYVGEDAYLSFINHKENGVKTIVPIHYQENMELWGSLPECARKYGEDLNAISSSRESFNMMHRAIQELEAAGWDRVAIRSKNYEEKVFKQVKGFELNGRLE